MGIYLLPVTQNLAWYRLLKSCFNWHHTFQHCSNMFKLNKHARCLNLTINNQSMWIESNSSLPTSAKVCKRIALSLVVSAISSFPELLSHKANMIALLSCSTLFTMLLYLGNYKQCSIQLLKMLHKCCNTSVLRVLLIYSHSP